MLNRRTLLAQTAGFAIAGLCLGKASAKTLPASAQPPPASAQMLPTSVQTLPTSVTMRFCQEKVAVD